MTVNTVRAAQLLVTPLEASSVEYIFGTFGHIDLAVLGRARGADGHTISAPEDLRSALLTAIQNRRSAVLDVPMVNEPVPTPGHRNIKDIHQGVLPSH